MAMFETLTGCSPVFGSFAIDAHISKPTVRQPAQKGESSQAIGTSRGGRTKNPLPADEQGRSRLILLTPGNASDMANTPALIAALLVQASDR